MKLRLDGESLRRGRLLACGESDEIPAVAVELKASDEGAHTRTQTLAKKGTIKSSLFRGEHGVYDVPKPKL